MKAWRGLPRLVLILTTHVGVDPLLPSVLFSARHSRCRGSGGCEPTTVPTGSNKSGCPQRTARAFAARSQVRRSWRVCLTVFQAGDQKRIHGLADRRRERLVGIILVGLLQSLQASVSKVERQLLPHFRMFARTDCFLAPATDQCSLQVISSEPLKNMGIYLGVQLCPFGDQQSHAIFSAHVPATLQWRSRESPDMAPSPPRSGKQGLACPSLHARNSPGSSEAIPALPPGWRRAAVQTRLQETASPAIGVLVTVAIPSPRAFEKN